MGSSGCCEYCGQTVLLDGGDNLPFPLTEAELNEMATKKCSCPQAKSERRKAETREKINEFIETEVAEEARDFVRAAVDMIKGYQCDSICLQTNDGWKVTVKLNKDSEIVFSCKKSLSKKAVF